MSFASAIRSGFANYANFKGRASRREYWWWTLFIVIVYVGGIAIAGDSGTIVIVPIALPSLAMGVRRLHDVDQRGWWMLIPQAAFVFSFWRGHEGSNRFWATAATASVTS